MDTVTPIPPDSQNVQLPTDNQPLRRDANDVTASTSSPPNSFNPPSSNIQPNPIISPASNLSATGQQDISDDGHGFPPIFKVLLGLVAIGIIGLIFLGFISRLFSNRQSVQDVTLTYWGLWEPKSVMTPILADFEKQNPHIHVDYIQEDSKQYTERLVTRINGGNGPDIFRFHNSWMPLVVRVLSPLPSSVISKQEFQKNFYPVMQSDLIQNGALYGIPLGIDTLALFTNDSMFKAAGLQPPTNWTDFLSIARTLTVKDDSGKIKTSGAAIGTFDNVNHAPDFISMLFLQNGADLTDFSKKQQNASDALLFYTSFANAQNNVWDQTLENSINGFAKGGVGMYFGYSWDIFTIRAINPSLRFSVHTVPRLPGRNMTIANYWVEGVSNKSQHQKEAFMLLNYLSQKDTIQKIYSEEAKTRPFGELYPRSDLALLLKDNPLIYPFIQQAPDAQSTYFVDETHDNTFSAQMNGYLGNTVRAVLGGTSPQSALDTLSKGEKQVLQQYASTSSQ